MAIRFEDKADAPKSPRRPGAANVRVAEATPADSNGAHPKPEPKAKGRKKKA